MLLLVMDEADLYPILIFQHFVNYVLFNGAEEHWVYTRGQHRRAPSALTLATIDEKIYRTPQILVLGLKFQHYVY